VADLTFRNIGETYSVAIPFPGYGYTAEIHMPISKIRAMDFTYPDAGFFDPPDEGDALGTYDYRVCKISEWVLTEAQKLALNGFLNNPAYGRGENFIMDLGAVASGFFPFGPDMGDQGKFTVRLIGGDDIGMSLSPYRRFVDAYSFVLVSVTPVLPAFTITSMGDLQIGACTGLLFPQSGFDLQADKMIYTKLSLSGAPNSTIGPTAADSYLSSFNLLCDDGRAYTLLDELINTVRSNDVTVVVPAYSYMFGRNNGSSGSYVCKFLGSADDESETVISITHNGYQQWIIPLKFYRKSTI
jgi:hypothetical protein